MRCSEQYVHMAAVWYHAENERELHYAEVRVRDFLVSSYRSSPFVKFGNMQSAIVAITVMALLPLLSGA